MGTQQAWLLGIMDQVMKRPSLLVAQYEKVIRKP